MKAILRRQGWKANHKRVARPWRREGLKVSWKQPRRRKLWLNDPWENRYIESFNGKLRDEPLHEEVRDTLLEAKVLVQRWRTEYDRERPHSALGYRPPAPEAFEPKPKGQDLKVKRECLS